MTGSNGNKGVPVDPILLEKLMVSGRVPHYVVSYAKDRNISISELIMAGFDAYRENDVNHALERLSYHETRVLHWRQKVLHNEQECNTKTEFCNTIREEFNKAERGQYPRHQNLVWLEKYLKQFIVKGIPMSVEELYKEVTRI